ncbi:hypothetical protein L484_002593 [Morus notabilis]|uniref:Bifunctional inhibitor/plant lipid transfer protein/seed storage helical domain-containing protein n=1 Tax=Morus notabilis TaxID=981085 RepID=W9RZA4_9ROSA|nr:hypothetical protein L484_002593 [Morus notabilis]
MASPAYSPWSPAISLLAISVLLHSATAPPPELVPPSTPPTSDCVNDLVMFSPCLSFVSSPPNNLSGEVPSKCCDAFSTTLNSASGFCLCFLLRQPRMLGFPLDESKVLSLPSLCPQRNPSLQALCSGS